VHEICSFLKNPLKLYSPTDVPYSVSPASGSSAEGGPQSAPTPTTTIKQVFNSLLADKDQNTQLILQTVNTKFNGNSLRSFGLKACGITYG
jgi:hypothetical protein